MGGKLGVRGRTASSATTQGRMILLSPDAVEDVERLRTFLDQTNPGAARRALALIWTAIERLQEFPALGMQTEDADVRQIVIRFGTSGYIIRYTIISETADILVTRVWTRSADLIVAAEDPVSTSFENATNEPDLA